jgi:hypothetical protein
MRENIWKNFYKRRSPYCSPIPMTAPDWSECLFTTQ